MKWILSALLIAAILISGCTFSTGGSGQEDTVIYTTDDAPNNTQDNAMKDSGDAMADDEPAEVKEPTYMGDKYRIDYASNGLTVDKITVFIGATEADADLALLRDTHPGEKIFLSAIGIKGFQEQEGSYSLSGYLAVTDTEGNTIMPRQPILENNSITVGAFQEAREALSFTFTTGNPMEVGNEYILIATIEDALSSNNTVIQYTFKYEEE